MRARLPNSLLTGLIWFGAHDYVSQSSLFSFLHSPSFFFFFWLVAATDIDSNIEIRHACDQGDGLTSYTFTEHDGRNSAVQIIKDLENNVEIKTELLKIPGGKHGKIVEIIQQLRHEWMLIFFFRSFYFFALVGGSWGVRISGKPMVEGKNLRFLRSH